jgi:ribosomal protein S18 acetylase RimI-like enzyme
MNPYITIQKASLKHASDIARFNIAMAKETEDKVLEKERIEPGVKALFSRPELGFYLVAEAEGNVIGSLMITKEWSDWRNGLFWWIQSVYIVPDFRRRGVYRAMYNKVKELAREEGNVCGFRLYVERENETAQKTYASLGMRETSYKLFEEEI